MKKLSLLLTSLLIISSSAYAKTPAERAAMIDNHYGFPPMQQETVQDIQQNRAQMRSDYHNMHEGNHMMMCKKCKHHHHRHHHHHHAKKAAKAAAKTEAKEAAKTESKSK